MKMAALVVGASRGIGRQVALTLSQNGYKVGVAAKTTELSEKLPGTIFSVANEIQSEGGDALPIPCNVREVDQINDAVNRCISNFGTLDVVVYNAGAILWKKVADTPLKRFDLMHEVNARGSYALIQAVLPYFLERKSGKILLVAPPIYSRFFKGKTPYSMTKVGMTVLVHGLANELKDTGVSISALWPATVIESQVTAVGNTPKSVMRNSHIFADACLAIIQDQTDRYNGEALIDEDLLRSRGMTDFRQYRCDPDQEPPRMMPKQFPSLRVEEQDAPPVMLPESKL